MFEKYCEILASKMAQVIFAGLAKLGVMALGIGCLFMNKLYATNIWWSLFWIVLAFGLSLTGIVAILVTPVDRVGNEGGWVLYRGGFMYRPNLKPRRR